MIDTVKFYAHITNLVFDRLRDEKSLEHRAVKLYGNAFYLIHPFKYDNPRVCFNLEKRELCIETSIPKLLQGHNVFGCNDGEPLCIAVVNLIYRQLGLQFSSRERHLVIGKRIRFGRLDAACSFRMESSEHVTEALESCAEQLRAEGRSWANEGRDDFESIYHQKHSKRVAEKFYNKYAELQVKRHKIPDGVAERDLVMQYAGTLLRFEVTWRAPELRGLKVEYANQWTDEIVREKLMKRVALLNLQGVIKQYMAPERLGGLNTGAEVFYDLWMQGCNLRRNRHYPPLSRARELLLEHGVDIFRRPEACSDIALNELLTEENAYFVGPKALTGRGAIFGV